VEHCKRGNRCEGLRLAQDALRIDPGIDVVFNSSGRIPRAALNRILSEVRFPLTLTWLAAFCNQIEDYSASRRLLHGYISLAPNAPDREHVKADLAWFVHMKRLGYFVKGRLNSSTASLGLAMLNLRARLRLRTRLRHLFRIGV
jgi:hypothetical protein